MVNIPKTGQLIEIKGLYENWGSLSTWDDWDSVSGKYKILEVTFKYEAKHEIGDAYVVLVLQPISEHLDKTIKYIRLQNLEYFEENIIVYPEGESSELLYV